MITKEKVKSAVIIVLSVVAVVSLVTAYEAKHTIAEASVIYQPASESLVENGFYPGRVYGDYSDYVFCFDAYLNSIGATNISRYIYHIAEETVYELRFSLNGFDWILKTNEFRTDCLLYGYYSQIEAGNGKIAFHVPTENCGTHICDATSPFKIDWVIFDVFHNATDENSGLKKELCAGLDESNCPFMGLGIEHYEKEPDGKTTWHDDLGDFTIAEGLDLHY